MVVTTLFPLRQALKECRGVSATEYALMAVGMAGVTLAGWHAFGGGLSGALGGIGAGLVSMAANL